MKNLKNWSLILCLAGPTVTNFWCAGAALKQVWDAALTGTADCVAATTTDFLRASNRMSV